MEIRGLVVALAAGRAVPPANRRPGDPDISYGGGRTPIFFVAFPEPYAGRMRLKLLRPVPGGMRGPDSPAYPVHPPRLARGVNGARTRRTPALVPGAGPAWERADTPSSAEPSSSGYRRAGTAHRRARDFHALADRNHGCTDSRHARTGGFHAFVHGNHWNASSGHWPTRVFHTSADRNHWRATDFHTLADRNHWRAGGFHSLMHGNRARVAASHARANASPRGAATAAAGGPDGR